MNKDMSQYRENRINSRVVQTWLNDYKEIVMQHVIFRTYQPESFDERWLKLVNENPEVCEIVADTIIGWLNSPVGRDFIRQSFDVKIESGYDGLDISK